MRETTPGTAGGVPRPGAPRDDGSRRPRRGPRAPRRRGAAPPRRPVGRAGAFALAEDLGVDFSPAWAGDEIKQSIKERLCPKGDSVAQRALSALKRLGGMKKADLIKEATSWGRQRPTGRPRG